MEAEATTEPVDDIPESYSPQTFDLFEDPSQGELGQKNDTDDIRHLVTNRKLRNIGIRIIGEIQRVDHGTWNGSIACFIQFGFQFSRTRDDAEVDSVTIHLSFKLPEKGRRRPTVRQITPGRAEIYHSAQQDACGCFAERPFWSASSEFDGAKNNQDITPQDTQIISITASACPERGPQNP